MELILIIFVTLLFSAFFSGMEIAFVSANRLRIELDNKQNKFPSNILKIFSKNPSQYISTMLVGNNLALVIYGLFMARLIEPYIRVFAHTDGIVLLIQTIVSTIIIIVLAEFIPKTLFRIDPNQTLRVFAIPVYLFYIIFYPIAKFTAKLSRILIRLVLRVKISDNTNVSFTKVDLNHLVNDTQGIDNEKQEINQGIKIFQNALDLSNIKLRECIVPRTEIEAVAINDTVELLKQKFIETGYSKIMVYEDSIDNIIGFAASIMIFQKPNTIANMVQKLPIVPETMPANKLLALFIQNKKSMALVVDEFGGTSGIVTMEDILEEIVGDIQDEHDKISLIDQKISDNEFEFSGRLEIDDLNEKYNFNLPLSDDYETIAGLILSHFGSIPKVNDIITINKYSFLITNASTTKIELVKLKILR